MSVLHVSCDIAAARRAEHATRSAYPQLALVVTILASGLAFVDGSVINVGLPAIGRSLSADAGALQWVVNAYLLPLGALLLLGGAAGDRFGRRRLLIAGTSLFGLASLLCSLAPGLGWLLAGRLLQGVGAAMLMPNSLAILGATFTGEAKGRAIGIWSASGAALGAIGPVLGGWLIDIGSWRLIFLLNLPLALAAILLARHSIAPDERENEQPLDWLGGLLTTVGLGALTFALTRASGSTGFDAGTIGTAVAALLVLILFLVIERGAGDQAMMPLSLFASRSFVGLTLLTLLMYGALASLFVLIPYILIEAAHYSGTAAGAALLPLPLVLAVGSPLMGALAGRIGPRLPLAIGPLIVAGGFLMALRIDTNANYWTEVMPTLLVIAVGMSGIVAPLTNAVLNAVDAQHTGSASGFNSTVARSGGLIAIALLGSVFAAQGDQFVSAFRVAMLIGAAACVAASASALLIADTAAQNRKG